MRKYRIAIVALFLLSVLFCMVGCQKTEQIGNITVVTKNGTKFIDCSQFGNKENTDTSPFDDRFSVDTHSTPVVFNTEEEMLTAMRNYHFTDAQKIQMSGLSHNRLLTLPTVKYVSKLTSTFDCSLDKIKWFGENRFEYLYSLHHGENTTELIYEVFLDVKEAKSLIAEKEEELNVPYNRTTYELNNIQYTQTNIVSPYAIAEPYYQELYWSYENGNIIYYVHQYKYAATEALLAASPYLGADIVVQDADSFHRILINGSHRLPLTPEFLEQLSFTKTDL